MKLVLLLLVFSITVSAQDVSYYDYVDYDLVAPAEGMWFDKDEPGRGLSLEIQDQRLLITYFGYQADGDAQWWQGVGYQEDDSNVYTGGFVALKDGQCNNCPYQQPSLDTDNEIGEFTLTFSSGNEAFFEWDGKDMELSKYYYGYNDTLDRAKGLWQLKAEGDNLRHQVSEFLLFDEVLAGSDKTKVITGYETGTAGFAAATSFIPQSGDGKEAIVFAYALPNGSNKVFAVYLDHVKGRSDLNNLYETGFFDFDADSDTLAQPVKATKMASLAESQPYIDFYNDYLDSVLNGKSIKNIKVGNEFVSPGPRLKAKMDILEAVIQDMYNNL